MRKESGITLIALVVTIVVLLILAGTSIAMLTGDNGILSQTKEAKIKNEESVAREKLELELGDLIISKNMDSSYNENEYIDNKLTNQGMIIIDDIVLVDGWQFQIDRTIPEIVAELGKCKENENIQIDITPTISTDYVNANLNIKITYDGEISEIKVNGNTETIPTSENGVYTIDRTIEQNGTYTVVIKDKDGNYKIGAVKVTDITEDMDIWNREDMEKFRNMVNSGRTFEKRTARVMVDIDLEGSEGNQWIPIGRGTTFKGTFEGNYHKINNLYVNSSKYSNLGFFTSISSNATIQNIILENVTINNTYNVESSSTGGIVGDSNGKIINCGINSGKIESHQTSGGGSSTTWKIPMVGGIVGLMHNQTTGCYNKAIIKVEGPKADYTSAFAGGIAGFLFGTGIIESCYNEGNINGVGQKIEIGGIVGEQRDRNTKLNNSYNRGTVTGTGYSSADVAGVVGRNGFDNNTPAGTIYNCFCTKTTTYSYYSNATASTQGMVTTETLKTYASKLGEAFTNDEQNEEGIWRYNEGYPILKWQINVK